ncbi:hypothetical protein CL614_01425 [archaeon]|nr:hypothetical protein [archaeon]|tara:strand:+ start:682 stop:1260 length:579 start_codon:yes stop_codon:yes gene_type:complete
MKWQSGKVLKEFDIEKDGKKLSVKFRFLKKNEDAEEMTKYINNIVSEKDNWLSMVKVVTLEQESNFLKSKLKEQGGKNKYVVVDVDGKFSGSAEVRFGMMGNSHTCSFGISLLDYVRGMGIGTKLMEFLIKFAKKNGAEILYIEAYKGNKRALHIYENKLGFKEYGVKPKFRKKKVNGKVSYDDEVLLWRKI